MPYIPYATMDRNLRDARNLHQIYLYGGLRLAQTVQWIAGNISKLNAVPFLHPFPERVCFGDEEVGRWQKEEENRLRLVYVSNYYCAVCTMP